MYSWEIDNVIKEHGYHIPSYLYEEIILSSPQIHEIKYDSCGDTFRIRTKDNYNWTFFVYYSKQ